MTFSDDPNMNDEPTAVDDRRSKPIDVDEVLADLRGGLRTKGFLYKYGLTMAQFEDVLKGLIRRGLFTKDEFRAWKGNRPVQPAQSPGGPKPQTAPPPAEPPRPPERQPEPLTVEPPAASEPKAEPAPAEPSSPAQPLTTPGQVGRPINVATYVIHDPEKNNSWALQLFSTEKDRMRGAKFKVMLHGKKYAFEIEEMLFRGSVEMLPDREESKAAAKSKREEAMEYISSHGWAAYLERRAVAANLGLGNPRKTARLVLLHCRNQTFLAALHTPTPAINLYVGTSLEKVTNRLSKSIDTSKLGI